MIGRTLGHYCIGEKIGAPGWELFISFAVCAAMPRLSPEISESDFISSRPAPAPYRLDPLDIACDQPRRALKSQVGPGPFKQDDEPVAKANQPEDVDE